MYKVRAGNKKIQKKLEEYIRIRNDIKDKLVRLGINPRKETGAHPLHGDLTGKWACWLGSNIRMIYIIDNKDKEVKILGIGTHNIY